MPMEQTAAVGRQDSCFGRCCTVSCYSHYYRRLTGNGQHCYWFGFPVARTRHRQCCLSHRSAADGDDETADDCYNAVAEVDNADSVAQ